MAIRDLLLTEFDEEMKKTRTMLERVPAEKKDFAPHTKSMTLGRLAPHVAELSGFGLTVLTTPGLDFGDGSYKPLAFESTEQLVRALDDGGAKVRHALQNMPDEAWKENWKLSYQGKPLFEGPRFPVDHLTNQNPMVSSADGPYVDGRGLSFRRRYTPS